MIIAWGKRLARLKEIKRLYFELLWGVATKHPNETRHQTALRYILESEHGGTEVGCDKSSYERHE